MPGPETMIAFLAAAAAFAYLPGPAMIYAAAQTLARGRRGGLMAALGIHLGGYAHVVAAALGLSVVFEAVPTAYAAVKLAGAAYLGWLGLSLILRRDDAGAGGPEAGGSGGPAAGPARRARRAFVESVLVEVLNPKTALFFLAFLPQFADPAAALPIWAQLLVLGTIVNLMFSSADLISIAFAGAVVDRLSRPGAARRLLRLAGGGLLLGLAGKLALEQR